MVYINILSIFFIFIHSVGKASRLALTNVSSPAPSGSNVSTGARGREQISFHGTGPDSDSNSMSTDSVTSRQSHPRANSHGASMRVQNNVSLCSNYCSAHIIKKFLTWKMTTFASSFFLFS